ncbi:MAG: pyrroline-5-carboxylate reductase [Rikenellaceae bacterium]|jgi:pyrroline-5-carboxylate reductase|nr:pyrroline-5-carboxylate reductase [Rikenellaceae bacterium]
MKNLKITVIGGGNMGGALIEGFLKSGQIAKEQIVVATPDEPGQKRFRALGLTVFADNRPAVEGANLVIVAVKPWLVETVATDIKGALRADTLIVSVAAGVSLDTLRGYFGENARCFRAIPNIAAALGEAVSFVTCGDREEASLPTVLKLFGLVGEAASIPEKLMDAGMVVASCGTAYALRYVRAAMEASIEMGLAAGLSRTVVAQTMRGAAALLLNGDLHPEALIDQVTTPGGVTIVGLNAMEQSGFTASVIEGHKAAYKHVKGK